MKISGHDSTFCVLCLSGGHSVPAPGHLSVPPAPSGSPRVKITFAGGGDDIVTVRTGNALEEYYTLEHGPIMWRAQVAGPEPAGGLIQVTAMFDECWGFAVGQWDDRSPLPDWPITIRQHPNRDYSALLEIDAPAGTTVGNIWPRKKQGNDADS